jgi:predicted alpha-1,2-mannosidase
MRIALICYLLLCVAASAQSKGDLASQVNSFIGTSTSWIEDNGNTLPGAVRPFGMLYWSPDRSDGTFYRFEGTATRGFSLTHLSGPGCSVYGDVPILPILGGVQVPPPWHSLPYQATYQPEDQVAQPGYYGVKLATGIRAQLAAAVHSGIAEFSFPDSPDSKEARSILIDLSRNLTRVNQTEIHVRKRTVTGSVESDEFCGNENHYRVFFALEVDQEPVSTGTFDELKVKPGGGAESGPRAGGYLTFSPAVRTVHLKVGISYVSVPNAILNLRQEIPGWDFGKVRKDAREEWNEALGHARVEGGTEAQRRIFYTALYHSFLHPSVFSDVNGDYMGFDNKIHRRREGLQYANFSGWDIYRCQVQLIAMLFPKLASDMAQSLVADAEQGGGLPIWPVANDESSVMVGDPSDPILASMYAFGARDFDARAALAAMLKGADDQKAHVRLYAERPGLEDYLKKGYVAQRPEAAWSTGAASVTLEDTSADFAISQLAKALGDTTTARRFLLRSAYWRNLFDPETKYIRARDGEGKFLPDFSPAKTDGFVEGNAAQYTWMVPYDLPGVIQSLGGPEAARARLDEYFSEYGKWTGSGYTAHFFISNEPSFGNPWIYNWTGHPWRTQEVVSKTLHDLFTDSAGGLPGNDDLGATSSWAVFAYLGLYPEIPGVGGLTLNTPTFPNVTLKLGGHELRIRAQGAPEKSYIQSVALDGKPLRSYWLDWEQVKSASVLEFTLSGEPSKEVGGPLPSFSPAAR